MAEYNRPAKPVSGDGGTSFVDGNNLPASELNDEFDAIQAVVNGGLDEDNLDAATQIPNAYLVDIAMSKVLDLADDITAYKATTTPNDTATVSLPTNLAQEMARLRYRIDANKKYMTNVYYMNTSGVATAAASWIEPPIVGPNLLPNPGFEVKSSSTATDAPDGWTLVGTPADCSIETPSSDHKAHGVEKSSLRILTDAANEGISVAVGGLKTGVKYLVGMTYTLTNNGTVAGVLRLETTGGLASGSNYSNLALDTATESAASVVTVQGIVKPTTVPGSITVKITGTESGADFNIINVWMYEMSDGIPAELPSLPMQTATYSTANDTLTNSGAGAWSNRADLTLSQYIPFTGYRLTYETTICFRGEVLGSATDEKYEYAFRIQQTIDSDPATTVEGPYAWRQHLTQSGEGRGGIVTLKYVVENPTPGSTYSFSTDVYTDGSAGDEVNTIIFNPDVGSAPLATQSQARLIVERI